MKHAAARRPGSRVERHRVAEDHASLAECLRERRVGSAWRFGGGTGLREPRIIVAIAFGKHDVECNGCRALIAQVRDQPTDQVAAPRPLTDCRQAAFVDVDDDDLSGWRFCWAPAKQEIVHAIVEPGDERGAIKSQDRNDERRHEAAQEGDATNGRMWVVRGQPVDYLTAISTRRLRGSSVSSGVFPSRSRSPCDMTSRASALSPAFSSRFRMVVARLRPSSKFAWVDPVVSVCPTTTTSGTLRSVTAFKISGTRARDSSVSSSDSNRKCRVKRLGGGGSAASASPKSRSTSPSASVVTSPGGPSPIRVESRPAARSTLPAEFETR